MTDSIEILHRMISNVMEIDRGDYPQKIKDDSKKIMNQSLDFTIEETSTGKINQLVIKEYRKRKERERLTDREDNKI